VSKKPASKEWLPNFAIIGESEVRAFIDACAKEGQSRLDAENERIARVAAKEICSVFNVRVPEERSFANSPMETIAIIIAEQIKYRGHARDEKRRTK
jgi:hypothetical protein